MKCGALWGQNNINDGCGTPLTIALEKFLLNPILSLYAEEK
jgi:hypothetical protein